MNRLCVVVDALNGLSQTQKSKIKRLSGGFNALTFVINAYNPYFERSYFYNEDEFKSARDDYAARLITLIDEICADFSEVESAVDILENRKKDLATFLRPLITEVPNTWLLLTTAELINRHTVHLEVLRTFTCPVLMFTNRGWAKQLLITAAIDPVHQEDINLDTDRMIVSHAKTVSDLLSARLKIVHSRYVPRSLDEYRQEIRLFHNRAVEWFTQKEKLENINVESINGNPEDSLVSYVQSNGTDLLVMGSLSRDSENRWFVGSTSENILHKMPCDILFVNYRNEV